MKMAYDKYFGFDTTQKQTLEKLLAEVASGAAARATTTEAGTVLQGATVAAAPAAFADLTAAATAYNALRTSLRDAGIVA